MCNTNNRIFYTFPPRDSLGLLVCYRAHLSLLETVEHICVAIYLRSINKMTGLKCWERLPDDALTGPFLRAKETELKPNA